MTRLPELWKEIQKSLSRDQWTNIRDIYTYVERSIKLDDEDYDPQSPTSGIPKWKRNIRNVLQYRKGKGHIEWDGNENYKL